MEERVKLQPERLSPNALEILKRRYLLKNNNREVVETPQQLFRRVASYVAQAETFFPRHNSVSEVEDRFFSSMSNLEFLPNSPTLMNAGTPIGQLSACFVIPVEDSIEQIFNALSFMARIHQTGGGTGFDFSHLRPKGDLVYSTKGQASGPVSFMSIFDQATGVIIQGGRRRGANMGVLRCDHPDIVEFIQAKLDPSRFTNFNLSVGITNKFMEAYQKNKHYDLINPRTQKSAGKLKARYVFDLIVKSAWSSGDPGLVFLDEINRHNPLQTLGSIETTNPCGELPLLPYESCNLGSINLSKMVRDGKVDWEKLADSIRWAVRFLDDVIEVNEFPLPKIETVTQANRKIGLGVMGFADLLGHLKIPYASSEAILAAGKLMRFVRQESIKASVRLAEERGTFPNYKFSTHSKNGLKLRNATVNSIAPTGTISLIAGCSSGIEPLFAVSFVRDVLSGTKLFEVNSLFKQEASVHGIYSERLMKRIAETGTIQNLKEIPGDLRKVFQTALDITPAQHLLIQAAFQRCTDNAVSKTINLPARAAAADIKKIYMAAYRLKCKGITVYRYGSRKNQVLSYGNGVILSGAKNLKRDPSTASQDDRYVKAAPDYSGGCAKEICNF